MKILALEFSSARRSVAVASPATSMSEVVESGPGAMRPLVMVNDILQEARLERGQIECLAIGIGPGSYTGIRAAIALAQGWQLARGTRLLGISSAECLARQAHNLGLAGRVNVVIDAQRDEVYLGAYHLDAAGCHEAEPLRLTTVAEAREREQAGEVLVGPEAARWFPTARVLFPSAATLAQLAAARDDFVAGEEIRPIYLRETNFVKAPPPRNRVAG